MKFIYVGKNLSNNTEQLVHHGIKGQRWGVRRYQNSDGTLTAAGKLRYNTGNTNVRSRSNNTSNANNTETTSSGGGSSNNDIQDAYEQLLRGSKDEVRTKFKQTVDNLKTVLYDLDVLRKGKSASVTPIEKTTAELLYGSLSGVTSKFSDIGNKIIDELPNPSESLGNDLKNVLKDIQTYTKSTSTLADAAARNKNLMKKPVPVQ